MSSEGLHESETRLRPETIDRHRAIASLMEELEAVDWYDQRVDAATDPELAEILRHNRDEEKEHAAMVLEWIRRRDPVLDRHLRHYLFTTGSIVGLESDDAPVSGEDPDRTAGASGALGIGALRDKEGL